MISIVVTVCTMLLAPITYQEIKIKIEIVVLIARAHYKVSIAGDVWASSSQTRQPRVRDLAAARKVKIGDSSASSSQTRQPCVRDLIAVKRGPEW